MAEDKLAERDFLLQSLDDLDRELAAGNIDAKSYRVLHDDYTARAAAVIKSLDDGEDHPVPDAPESPRRLKWLTITAIVIFVALAGYFLAHTAGTRSPGQTITGNNQVNRNSTPTTLAVAGEVTAAKAAVSAQPNSYAERIRYARDLLQVQNYPEAIKQYTAASRIDPTQAEPLAYSGWISAVVSQSVNDANLKTALLDGASARVNQAISVDPTYPDAYVFKGLLLSQLLNKPCDAVPAFQRFLVLAPQDNPMRNQVLDALSQAVQAGKCPTANTVKP